MTLVKSSGIGVCVEKESWSMVSFIKSRASNFRHRRDIRSTWGKVHSFSRSNLWTVFVIARGNGSFSDKIKEESSAYKDILYFDAPDGYRWETAFVWRTQAPRTRSLAWCCWVAKNDLAKG